MDDQKYRVEGTLPVVVRDDRGEIPIDGTDQRFCDFLSWASRDKTRLEGTQLAKFSKLPVGTYFAERSKFLDECKRKGLLLHVVDREEQSDRHFAGEWMNFEWDRLGLTLGSVGSNFLDLRKRVSSEWGEVRGIEGPGIERCGVLLVEPLVSTLIDELSDMLSDARRISDIPVVKSFVYLDVSDFSEYSPIEQTLIINSICQLSHAPPNAAIGNMRESFDAIEARLCIGDGYIFCFADPMHAVFFAGVLASEVEVAVAKKSIPTEFHFRMGVHTGEVYHFWDPGRDAWNYIGDGINGGSRVLEAIGKDTDDVVFISSEVRQRLVARRNIDIPYPEIFRSLINRGRRKDKHGNVWRVYEFSHAQFAEQLHLLRRP